MRRLALLLLALALPALVLAAPDRFTRPSSSAKGKTRAKSEDAPKPERVPLARQPSGAKPLAIVGADLHPVTAPDVPGGTLLLKDGRIEAILTSERTDVAKLKSAGYEILDAKGRQAYPGFVALGVPGLGLSPDAWEGGVNEAVTQGLSGSFNAWSDDVELMASAGITSALVYRGAGGDGPLPFVGRGAVLKMSCREPAGVEVKDPAVLLASPSLLTASGRRSVQLALEDAREARDKDDWDPDKARFPALLLDAAEGRLPVLVSADAAGDVATALDVARALRFSLVLYHPTDAWALAPQIAAAKCAVVQNVRTSWGKPRANRRAELGGGWKFDAVACLARAGVPTAVSPLDDDLALWGVAGRDMLNLPLEAAFAQRAGLSAQQALEAITIVPARILHVEDRVGSLEAGKDADVILADGDPLDYRTFVRTTIVGGKVVYRAEGNRAWGWALERRQKALGEKATVPEPAKPAAPAAAAGK